MVVCSVVIIAVDVAACSVVMLVGAGVVVVVVSVTSAQPTINNAAAVVRATIFNFIKIGLRDFKCLKHTIIFCSYKLLLLALSMPSVVLGCG